MKFLGLVILLALTSCIYATPSCTQYCTLNLQFCNGTYADYPDMPTCMLACSALPLGLDSDVSGNTIGCRTYHSNASASDPSFHCPHAGPTGGGLCGSYCDAYCNYTAAACNTTALQVFSGYSFCSQACTYFNVSGAIGDQSGNTLFCHLYHAQAALGDPTYHCPHASPSGVGVCGTRCDNYCNFIQQTCTGANAMFPDIPTCQGYCPTNPDGQITDESGNTKDCRVYHSLAAGVTADPSFHCPHASHSGGNLCGTWCQVYCNLATTICTGALQLFSSNSSCLTACANYPTTGVPGATAGNTVQCRIYHLGAAAATGDTTLHCPHGGISGGGVCVGGSPTSEQSTTGFAYSTIFSALMLVAFVLI